MQCPAICDFLQGPMTSQHAVSVVKEALAAGMERHFEILYYRKDGKTACRFNNYNNNDDSIKFIRVVFFVSPLNWRRDSRVIVIVVVFVLKGFGKFFSHF